MRQERPARPYVEPLDREIGGPFHVSGTISWRYVAWPDESTGAPSSRCDGWLRAPAGDGLDERVDDGRPRVGNHASSTPRSMP
jgi:hypothetical protein